MRKFLYAAGIAATLLSCNEAERELTGASVAAEVTLRILPAGTKGEAEGQNGTCDIFIFYGEAGYSGQLETHRRFSQGKELKLQATAGKREIFAILNMDEHDFSAVCTKSDLLSSVSRLEENKDGRFHMTGFRIVELKEGGNLLDITVRRFAARVKLKKITRGFSPKALAKQDFVIKEVFLSNAIRQSGFSSDYMPSEDDFVNKLGVTDTRFDYWLRRRIDRALVQNESFDTEQVLYTYPNPFTIDAQEGPFTARNTKLVVHASLDGESCYYVIALGALERNKSYEISELTLTRRGTDTPEEGMDLSGCEFKFSVSPWTTIPIENENGNYTI